MSRYCICTPGVLLQCNSMQSKVQQAFGTSDTRLHACACCCTCNITASMSRRVHSTHHRRLRTYLLCGWPARTCLRWCQSHRAAQMYRLTDTSPALYRALHRAPSSILVPNILVVGLQGHAAQETLHSRHPGKEKKPGVVVTGRNLR